MTKKTAADLLWRKASQIDPEATRDADYSGRGQYGRPAALAFYSDHGPASEIGHRLAGLGLLADSMGRSFVYYSRQTVSQ